MTLKIAFIGKICAGKTTASEYIMKQIPEMNKLEFADKLKESYRERVIGPQFPLVKRIQNYKLFPKPI